MTSRDFCYWLQGYFELSQTIECGFTPDQRVCIKKHLALVFKHEIDPSAGPPEHQAELDAIHSPEPINLTIKPGGSIMGGVDPNTGIIYRC